MNHLSVFLGIITSLFLGGSFFGIELIFQVYLRLNYYLNSIWR